MRDTFLHWIGNALRTQLSYIPLWLAHWFFVGLLLLMMGWIVLIPTEQATPPGRRSQWYEDLRIWAWLALLFQVIVYSIF